MEQKFDGIIDNCKRSVIYALIADESTDVTNKEKISICICFVGRKEDGKHLISEDNPVAREEMGRHSKLKVLCETR